MLRGSFFSDCTPDNSSDSDSSILSEEENTASRRKFQVTQPSVNSVLNKLEGDTTSLSSDSSGTASTIQGGSDRSIKEVHQPTDNFGKERYPKSFLTQQRAGSVTNLRTSFKDQSSSHFNTIPLKYKVNAAIKQGDIEKAIELSDILAIEEASAKRLKELEAKEFASKVSEANKRKIAQKRKKLNWTFETKRRWETKSNM